MSLLPGLTRKNEKSSKRYWACTRKLWFASKEEALADARLRGLKKAHGAYRCPHCKGFHLTTHPK